MTNQAKCAALLGVMAVTPFLPVMREGKGSARALLVVAVVMILGWPSTPVGGVGRQK